VHLFSISLQHTSTKARKILTELRSQNPPFQGREESQQKYDENCWLKQSLEPLLPPYCYNPSSLLSNNSFQLLHTLPIVLGY
jgi:hypothetical protein